MVFGAALALPAISAAQTAPSNDILLKIADWRALEDHINTDLAMPDDRFGVALDRMTAMEDELYRLPCDSPAAAFAKLTILNLSFVRGRRCDETEEEVMAEVLGYLRGRI